MCRSCGLLGGQVEDRVRHGDGTSGGHGLAADGRRAQARGARADSGRRRRTWRDGRLQELGLAAQAFDGSVDGLFRSGSAGTPGSYERTNDVRESVNVD